MHFQQSEGQPVAIAGQVSTSWSYTEGGLENAKQSLEPDQSRDPRFWRTTSLA